MPELCTNKLEALVGYLDGLTERADLDVLTRLLQTVDLTRDDLEPVCRFKPECYQRNTIKRTEWYELVALCWLNGQKSQIHDHRHSSCAFRVIDGPVTEHRYEQTRAGFVRKVHTSQLDAGSICAAADAEIHEVCNERTDGGDVVTLHIYSPPLRMTTYELDPGTG